MKINPAEKIKQLRKEKNLTQEELASGLGVTRQTIFAIESGRSEPSLSLAMKLCQMLDSAIDELFIDFVDDSIKINNDRKEVSNMNRAIIPFSPLSELTDLHREIDRFFEDASTANRTNNIAGAMNIKDNEKSYEIHISVPGYSEDELDIEVGEDIVTIKGNKEEEVINNGWIKKEFSFVKFERSVALPTAVDPKNVQAKLKNGTLVLTLPKSTPEQPKTNKIKVTRE